MADETMNPSTPAPTEDSEPTAPAGGGSGLLVKVVLVLGILAGAGAGAAAHYYRGEVEKLKNIDPQQAAQAETAALLAKVGELILLPVDEQPTIATVADPEKLKDQPFFINAHQGDRVLIYTNARKAILYDPVAHKIIEVAPVSIGAETAGATTPPPAEPPVQP